MERSSQRKSRPMKRFGTLLVSFSIGAMPLACGPKESMVSPVGPSSSFASASESVHSPSPLPIGVPVSPMGVLGARRASIRDDASDRCIAANPQFGGDEEEAVLRIAWKCNLPAASPVLKGVSQQGNGAKELSFRAKAGHCYRVLSAQTPMVTDLLIVLRDSQGDIATGTGGAPKKGKVCVEADDEWTILVSVGSGHGGFAVQVVEP